MGRRCGHFPRLLSVPEVPVLAVCRHIAWALGAGCPQRDSNPRYHLERVATWAASRWGRPSEDTRGRSYHPWPPGRLAQLVERLPYTQVAAGSSPAPPITGRAANAALSFPGVAPKSYETPSWSTDWSTGALPNPIEASEFRTLS